MVSVGVCRHTFRRETACVADDSNSTGAGLHAWGHYSPSRGDQEYRYNPTTGQIASFWGKCASVSASFPGIPVVLQACNVSDPRQRFSFDNSTGVLSMQAGDGSGPLCVDAGSSANCSMAPYNSYPYCNSSLGAADRAADLASRLNVADFANLLYDSNNGACPWGIVVRVPLLCVCPVLLIVPRF